MTNKTIQQLIHQQRKRNESAITGVLWFMLLCLIMPMLIVMITATF